MLPSLALALSLCATGQDPQSVQAALPAKVEAQSAPASEPRPTAAAPAMFPVERKLVEKTNVVRRRFGLRPLRLDRGLLFSARRHAYWMTRNHTLQHTTATVAENIAMGQTSSDEAIQSWMNSPGHRANMLNTSYSRVGAAAYVASNGSTYWCIQFLH